MHLERQRMIRDRLLGFVHGDLYPNILIGSFEEMNKKIDGGMV